MSDDGDIAAAEFALGVLTGADRADAEARYAHDPAFAAEVDIWHEDLAPLNDAIPPLTPSAQLWSRIEGELADHSGGSTIRSRFLDFTPYAPGIDIKLLLHDPIAGRRVSLFRLQPGASIAPHGHIGAEECFVLEGSIEIGDHIVHAGELHFTHSALVHPEIISKTGALLYISYPTA